jgi:hypothetical protein
MFNIFVTCFLFLKNLVSMTWDKHGWEDMKNARTAIWNPYFTKSYHHG